MIVGINMNILARSVKGQRIRRTRGVHVNVVYRRLRNRGHHVVTTMTSGISVCSHFPLVLLPYERSDELTRTSRVSDLEQIYRVSCGCVLLTSCTRGVLEGNSSIILVTKRRSSN